MSQVIEGAYEVLGIFDRVEEKRDAMQSLLLLPPAQQALAQAALTYRFGEDHQPVTPSQVLSPALAGRKQRPVDHVPAYSGESDQRRTQRT